MKNTYAAMMRVDADMACLIYDIPRADRADTAQYDIGLDAWIAAQRETGSAACIHRHPARVPAGSHRHPPAGRRYHAPCSDWMKHSMP